MFSETLRDSEPLARQRVAALVIAAQVVGPVEFAGQFDDRIAIASGERRVDKPDDLRFCQRVIHFERGRVQERGHGCAKEVPRGSADAAAPSEVQGPAETRVSEVCAATAQSEDTLNRLAGSIGGGVPVNGAILPESWRATPSALAFHDSMAFGLIDDAVTISIIHA